MSTHTKHRRIKRITPSHGFTLRELRELRRDYKRAHEQPILWAEVQALPNPFDDLDEQ